MNRTQRIRIFFLCTLALLLLSTPCALADGAIWDGPAPVSYTHLDVYKRQAKINPTIRQSHRAGSTKPIVSFWTAALRDAVPPSARSG